MSTSNGPFLRGQYQQSKSTELEIQSITLPTATKNEIQGWFSDLVRKHSKDDLNPEKTQQALANLTWDGLALYWAYTGNKADEMALGLRRFGFDPKLAKVVSEEAHARIQLSYEAYEKKHPKQGLATKVWRWIFDQD